jgi:hypothetical protein
LARQKGTRSPEPALPDRLGDGPHETIGMDEMRDAFDARNLKLQYWRAFPDVFARNAAPMLVLPILEPANDQARASAGFFLK